MNIFVGCRKKSVSFWQNQFSIAKISDDGKFASSEINLPHMMQVEKTSVISFKQNDGREFIRNRIHTYHSLVQHGSDSDQWGRLDCQKRQFPMVSSVGCVKYQCFQYLQEHQVSMEVLEEGCLQVKEMLGLINFEFSPGILFRILKSKMRS